MQTTYTVVRCPRDCNLKPNRPVEFIKGIFKCNVCNTKFRVEDVTDGNTETS